ncbi:MAG: septal ring lytic transglycosylase RlpA family protein [Immundisolibacteraceae bacterium]|nr:septal ring lytic transglycosylase RlpA family protein [Immundisolibacteraceae bacterium]
MVGCSPEIYRQSDGAPSRQHLDRITLADAVPKAERLCRGCFRPYQINGIRYQPLASGAGFRQSGEASWYGTAFHGKPTATGEPYNMFAMTAAHKTLPLPSYARVRNIENGRSIVVRLNDRGPFRAGRIVDLSYAAAVKLGIEKVGSAQVELVALSASASARSAQGQPEQIQIGVIQSKAAQQQEIVELPVEQVLSAQLSLAVSFNDDANFTAAVPTGVYFQAGSFSNQHNAARLRLKLLEGGVVPVEVVDALVDGRTLYRVRVGPVSPAIERLTLARSQGLGLELTRYKF